MHCLYHINKLPNRLNVLSEVIKNARIQNKEGWDSVKMC